MSRDELREVLRKALDSGHFDPSTDGEIMYVVNTDIEVTERLKELLAPAMSGPWEAYLEFGNHGSMLLAVREPFIMNVWRSS